MENPDTAVRMEKRHLVVNLPKTMTSPLAAKALISRPTKQQSEILTLLQSKPERLTDNHLITTPLRVISKGIGEGISSSRTIDIYLRWFEVQRLGESNKYNKYWPATIEQWAQSLRTRGFQLDEIIKAAGYFKARQGQILTNTHRRFPSSGELKSAWDAVHILPPLKEKRSVEDMDQETGPSRSSTSLKDTKSVSHWKYWNTTPKPSRYNYVCNRCGDAGHPVNFCPTNDDPSFDSAPDYGYQCKFCKKNGEHYSMFCPEDPDPESIMNRRKKTRTGANNVPLGTDSKFKFNDRIFNEKARKDELDAVMNEDEISLSRSVAPDNYMNELPQSYRLVRRRNSINYGRLTHDSDEDGTEDEENLYLSTTHRIGPMLRKISIDPTDSFDSPDHHGFSNEGRSYCRKDDSDHTDRFRTQREISRLKRFGDNTDEINSNLLDITSTRLDSLSDDDEIQNNSYPPRYSHFREDTVPLCKSAAVNEASQHAAFLSNVFSTHPSALNPEVRPRITALDMWEVSDDREMRAKIQRGEELESSFQEDMDKYFAIKILRAQGDGSWEIALDELITENRNWATARKVDTSEDGDTNMEEEWVTPSGSPARILQELNSRDFSNDFGGYNQNDLSPVHSSDPGEIFQ